MTMAQMTGVLIGPVVTEKSTRLQEEDKFTFRVALTANKTLVKQAVQTLFGVKVLKVTIVKLPGKRKRFGPRIVKGPDKKKAIVTLRPGEKITVFEGV